MVKIAKIASLYPPQSQKSPSLRVTTFEFRDEPDISRNYNVQALGRCRNHDASFLRFETRGEPVAGFPADRHGHTYIHTPYARHDGQSAISPEPS